MSPFTTSNSHAVLANREWRGSHLSSPWTPPRRSAPPRREFNTPSPPKSLLDLPKPSSSSESEVAPWNQAVASDDAWTANPTKAVDEIPLDLMTSARAANATAQQTKTPKPFGDWLPTTAPTCSPVCPQSEKAQGLFPPDPPSPLLQESSVDFRTPTVPGDWATAVREGYPSVSNPETPSNQSGPTLDDQAIDCGLGTATRSPASTSFRLTALHVIPRGPHLPHTSSVRMVDVFGREQESNTIQANAIRRRKGFSRAMEEMAQEIQETDDTTVPDSKAVKSSSRAELFSHIRQGLDDLVVDLEGVKECINFFYIFPNLYFALQ